MATVHYFQNWYPGEQGYKEHIDRQNISFENVSAIKAQTDSINRNLDNLSRSYENASEKVIASNGQIKQSIDSGFERLASINERGFAKVTRAIDSMHSDMNYFLGRIIQLIEYQNLILNEILNTLQEPFETQVKEYYKKGCLFVQQGFLEGAIDCFIKSLNLEMGKYFFPSYYQLGRIYLSGKTEEVNLINPENASKYLLKANEYGNRIVKTDANFKSILADCKFYLAQSFYYQLDGTKNSDQKELINNAIKYCKESVDLVPSSSQGLYHLSKYHSFRIGSFNEEYKTTSEIESSLIYFMKAVEIDRNYLRSIIHYDPFYDKVFESLKPELMNLIVKLTEIKKKDADLLLNKNESYLKKLDNLEINKSSNLKTEYLDLLNIVQSSKNDFKTATYFGYDDCIQKLERL